MRRALLFLCVLVLVGCAKSQATRMDDRTFRIDGPGVPGGSDTPNRRLAERLCPKGYRIVDQESHKGGVDRAIDDDTTMSVWTIRCL
jgi:hypothetical protein